MTTERTDHAAEARHYLEHSDEWASEEWPVQTGEHKADVIARAQVHATLALVEQQRIANVIALMDSPRACTNVARAAEMSLMVGEPVVERVLRPEVARLLGIGTLYA